MTGSLQVKNGKFYMIINDRENGKRKQKWIATGLDVRGNKRRAEQLLRETLLEYERTPKRPKCDLLFSDYIRSWLKVAERRVDSVTFQGYQLMANAQVIPYFDQSGIRLQDVTREALQDFFDEKARCGRKDGKGGLSPATLRQYKDTNSGLLLPKCLCRHICRLLSCTHGCFALPMRYCRDFLP